MKRGSRRGRWVSAPMGPQALADPSWRTDRLIVLSRVRSALRLAGISNMLDWIRLARERRDAFDQEVRNLIDGGRIGKQPAVLDARFAPVDAIDWTVTEVVQLGLKVAVETVGRDQVFQRAVAGRGGYPRLGAHHPSCSPSRRTLTLGRYGKLPRHSRAGPLLGRGDLQLDAHNGTTLQSHCLLRKAMESESRQTQAPTTWDGSPISHESPRGATIVVFRRRSHGPEFLMLHRAHHGVDYDGDWAWTPPSGVRLLGEPIITCAQRELLEETGLVLSLAPTDCGDEDWWVFLAEVSDEASVTLSDEHDQYAWWPGQIAITRCHPSRACEPLKAAVLLIEQARRRPR